MPVGPIEHLNKVEREKENFQHNSVYGHRSSRSRERSQGNRDDPHYKM